MLINLLQGELAEPTPSFITEAGIAALAAGETRYAPVEGIYELRNAIVDVYAHDAVQGPENVLITPGVRQAVFNVLSTLLQPGDEVVLCAPYWFAFPDLLQQVGAQVKLLEAKPEDDYRYDPAKLKALLSDKTKLFIINNPCNPTGKLYSQIELEALIEVLKDYPNVNILSDEIYQYLTYGASFTSMAMFETVSDRCVVVSGFSKAFAMTGWRIGYILASENMIQRFLRFQEITMSGVPQFTQRAAVAAIENRGEFLPALNQRLIEKRDAALTILKDLPIKVWQPESAYYLLPDVSCYFGKEVDGKTIAKSADIAAYLVTKAKVQVFNGAFFGAPNHIRVSFAGEAERVTLGLNKLATALQAL